MALYWVAMSLPPDQPPVTPPMPGPGPAPKRSWWGRNWKWVIPVGCLLPLLVCGGGITAIFFGVTALIKSSEPYKHALAQAQSNPAVVAALGTPITAGKFSGGTYNVSGSSGNANFAIPISGPKGSGVIYVVATQSAGKWTYQTLEVQAEGSPNRIPLQGGTSP